MDELDNNQAKLISPDKPAKPADETVIDIKFSLTRKKKIIFGLVGLGVILVISALTLWLTDLKYPVLGVFFKGSAEVTVADSKTLQPIEGAKIQIDGKSTTTNKDGKATINNLLLGKKKIDVTKDAYKDFHRDEIIFIGQNKLNPILIEGAGIPITFSVQNKITGLPLEGANVQAGTVSVKTGKDGTAILNILPTGGVKTIVKVSKDNFLEGTLEIKVEKTLTPFVASLTPSGKDYFLSNRGGKIDLYQSNLDGSDQTVLLAGTGNENNTTAISISPNNRWVSLLSTREGIRDAAKNLVSVLYILDPQNKSLSKVQTDLYVSLGGWSGDNLIYTSSNGKYDQDAKSTINVISASSKKVTTLASPNTLGTVDIIGNEVIFSLNDKTKEDYGLFMIKIDGADKLQILKEGTGMISKTSMTVIIFNSFDTNSWYSYNVASKKLDAIGGQPANLKNRDLVCSPNQSKCGFIEKRDGKNELYVVNSDSTGERKITDLGSVDIPIRWVGEDYIIFRVTKTNETADYITSVSGGVAYKIADIYTNPLNYYEGY